MMERLILNKLPYATLQMRPEFAELLKDIYPDLKNHPRVNQNEPPKCMDKSISSGHTVLQRFLEGATRMKEKQPETYRPT